MAKHDVCPGREEHHNDLCMAFLGSNGQCCPTIFVSRLFVGPGCEANLDDLCMVLLGSNVQWCIPVFVSLLFVGTIVQLPLRMPVLQTTAEQMLDNANSTISVSTNSCLDSSNPSLIAPVNVAEHPIVTMPAKVEDPSTVVVPFTLRTPAFVMTVLDPQAV